MNSAFNKWIGTRRGAIPLLALSALLAALSGCAGIQEQKDTAALLHAREGKEAAISRMEGAGPSAAPLPSPPADRGPALETGSEPEWVSNPPTSDPSWYYGYGRASLKDEGFEALARERALADAAAKITVTVRKETTDYSGLKTKGRKSVSEQEIEETVRTSTDARLRNPELVSRYRGGDTYHVLMRVSALTPLQRELAVWEAARAIPPTIRAGDFLDNRGIRTGFGEYLRDLVVSRCFGCGSVVVNDPAAPVVSGNFVVADGISITLRMTDQQGTIINQRTFTIPTETEYLAMMADRRDHALVNAAPAARWGGGIMSLGGEAFRDGDQITISFQPEVDCYVTVFNISEDGTVTVLLPNRHRRDNFVGARTRLVFPGSLEKEKGLVLRARLPGGNASTRESVKIVATQRPVNLAAGDFSEAVVEDYKPDSQGIRRLLAALEDLDSRGTPWFEEVQYVTIRAR